MSVGFNTVISRIILSYPSNCSFVIALGYQGQLVKEYIRLAHPDLSVTFVDIQPFSGIGSGLATTFQQCKPWLERPFIFNACDTLILEPKKPPSSNWLGYSPRKNHHQYRTLKIEDFRVVDILEKSDVGLAEEVRNAYAGIAGILNVDEFWENLDRTQDSSIDQGEILGLKGLLSSGVTAEKFQWFDTGSLPEFERTKRHFSTIDDDIVLDKQNERIWFCGQRVIKYSADSNFINHRIQRAQLLEGYVPQIVASGENMYAYQHITGKVLSRQLDQSTFSAFLNHCEDFWFGHGLPTDPNGMRENAYRFYHDKTLERINDFLNMYGEESDPLVINATPVEPIADVLARIDWTALMSCEPVRFHGDLHPENILIDSKSQTFMFLDWRQDFGGSLEWGDLYYELGKIRHGLIVSHKAVKEGRYEISMSGRVQSFWIHQKSSLLECDRMLSDWIHRNGYSEKRVNLTTALIFLNIASLHQDPYARLLFALGKLMLSEELGET